MALLRTSPGLALLAVVFLLAPAAAVAAGPPCDEKVMYVAAHQDDTLLFQSPDLVRDVQGGRCVRTVFLTAGDAGRVESYWRSRDAGAEAAYAQMAGVADEWTESKTQAAGHSLNTVTLKDAHRISIVYLRLPDGNTNGKGFPRYGEESLVKLWRGGNPGSGIPTISSITSVDGASTYGYQDLVETLEAVIESYEPRLIATQDFADGFFEGDHPDHTATAYFTELAQESYSRPHRLLAYDGYGIASEPENVFGEALEAKSLAFYAYGLHDSDACSDEESCSSTIYSSWLKRQYVSAARTVGVVADAGYRQEVEPGAFVRLDGAASSAESGEPLTYEWTQAKGPPVELTDADTAEPSFVAPPHPTLLTFALVVSDGSAASEPAFVTVRVPTDDPTPAAVAGPPQEVDPGAVVTLDGSGSWDPNSLPLEYSWVQTGGPPVTLSGASTAEPSFVAPSGPAATLTFSLTVSNGTRTSAPATQAVVVRGTPPVPPSSQPLPGAGTGPTGGERRPPRRPRLSASVVVLRLGKASRRVVKVAGKGARAIRCVGRLPRGARCRARGNRIVVRSTGALRRTGAYRLEVHISAGGRFLRRPLLVRIRPRR